MSAIAVLLASLAVAQEKPPLTPPEPEREFRGVWVATVANINWPSKPGLSVTAQKAELLALLDTAQANNLNAILFQVRPACDAFYKSDLEPWSEYLTGTMGQSPRPHYDPLEFAVSAAHRRGLELHAWFNPFRARHHTAQSPASAKHVSRTQPELVRQYGAYLWLDPGEPAAREHSLKVILDVVRRYDIDGVHFDDYFYPYPEKDSRGGTVPFPDRAAWEKYGRGLSRSDWRRKNVDTFVQQVDKAVHAEKPWLQFGVSPFGIWRPGYPKPVTGLDAYQTLFADARKWLQLGWVDYLVPQLYWSIESPGQSFPVLLEWWEEQNVRNRHLWIGLNTIMVGEQWTADELFSQIKLTRQFGLKGHVHYNIGEFLSNPAFAKALRSGYYPEPALPPVSPWRDTTPPPKPRLDLIEGASWRATWTPGEGEPASHWLLQTRTAGRWNTTVLPGASREQALSRPPDVLALRAVDRCGNLSLPVVEVLKPD